MARSPRRLAVLLLLVVLPVVPLGAGCVGSGKTAKTESIEPLPDGMRIVSDTTMGCREGESGFDYRFLVVGPIQDLSYNSPLLSMLRARNYYHSVVMPGDLAWVNVEYQHNDVPLRVEIGMVERYLANPIPHKGPSVDAIPAEAKADPTHWAIVAMRPTDFGCTTPL